MDIKIYFSIITHDGVDIGVFAEATLSGSYIPADFHHDIEDEREIDVTEINMFDEDGEEMNSEKLTQIAYEHVDDNFVQIFNDASADPEEFYIYLDDLKIEKNYTDLI